MRRRSFHNFIFLLDRGRFFWRFWSRGWLPRRATETLCCRSFDGCGGCLGCASRSRSIRINKDWRNAVACRDDAIPIGVVMVLLIRLLVVFLVKVENRMIVFAAFDVAIAFVTSIATIVDPIAVPLLRYAPLVTYAFEFIVVAEFAIDFILAARAISDVIASVGKRFLIKTSLKN